MLEGLGYYVVRDWYQLTYLITFDIFISEKVKERDGSQMLLYNAINKAWFGLWSEKVKERDWSSNVAVQYHQQDIV